MKFPGTLKNLAVGALNTFSPFISQKKLIKQSGQQVVGLFYHVVDDEACPHIDALYHRRSVAEFEKELDWLLKYYQPISLAELRAAFTEELQTSSRSTSALRQPDSNKRLLGKFKRPVFHLSFDDGLRQMSEVVAPILLRKGIPATFFLNSAFIDNRELFYRFKSSLIIERIKSDGQTRFSKNGAESSAILAINYLNRSELDNRGEKLGLDFNQFLQNYRPFMSSEQVSQLLRDGFEIGAHSHDHPRYSLLSFEQQLAQTTRSIDELRSKFQVPVDTFAFPFTDDGVSLAFFENLHRRLNVDLSFGGAGIKEDIFRNLQRFGPEQSALPLSNQLKTEYAWYTLRKLVNKHKIQRN